MMASTDRSVLMLHTSVYFVTFCNFLVRNFNFFFLELLAAKIFNKLYYYSSYPFCLRSPNRFLSSVIRPFMKIQGPVFSTNTLIFSTFWYFLYSFIEFSRIANDTIFLNFRYFSYLFSTRSSNIITDYY